MWCAGLQFVRRVVTACGMYPGFMLPLCGICYELRYCCCLQMKIGCVGVLGCSLCVGWSPHVACTPGSCCQHAAYVMNFVNFRSRHLVCDGWYVVVGFLYVHLTVLF